MDLNAKMSKSKKKKLKKREKRNQQLMEEAMKHAMEAKVILQISCNSYKKKIGDDVENPKLRFN